MPRLGLVIVASLGAQRAAGFTMISSSMRRCSGLSGVSGARRGVMAFLGGAAAMPYSRSRWVSTLMSAAAAQSAPGGPSLKVVTKRESAQHPAYEVLEEDFVTEYGATTTLYKHRKSGAEVLSVQIDDDNKVFGVTFRTPPEDSTGVPHILEHSVLCGSRKFPVKEPFVDLLKSSLQTFLNAFTYPDRTCYPVASQNLKDFYNLMNVYLDAVFFPRAVRDPQTWEDDHLETNKGGLETRGQSRGPATSTERSRRAIPPIRVEDQFVLPTE